MTVTPRVSDPLRLAAVHATGLLDTRGEEDFDRLARLAAVLLDAPFAFVTIVDETRSFWKACIGVDATDPVDRQNRVEESFCQYVVATEEPLIVSDAATDPRTAGNPSIASMGVAAWAGFPVRSPEGQVLGTFCVVDTVVREWTERDVSVLETLAAAASGEVALRTAVATATAATSAARTSQERLAFLASVSDLLATTVDAETAVGALAQRIVPFLADWTLITVVDETTGERRDLGRAHRDADLVVAVHRYAEIHRPTDTSPIPTAISTGEPVVVTKIDDDLVRRSLPEPASRKALAVLAPDSVAVFPLKGRGDPFGAVALYNAEERGAHSAGELRIAHEMTRRVGLLLENARLQARHRRLAEVLQRSLLTRPPVVDGLEIAVRYHPATEGTRVGGDWYDAYTQPDGSLILVIGDVVGHDLQAVGLMGQIRTMTRSIGYDRAASPAQVLTRVDEAIRGLRVDGLCTALVVHIDRRAATPAGIPFSWSSAGHPPPLITGPNGDDLDIAAAPELMLGVRPGAVRSDHRAVLPPGATLLLMTDGLFERRELSFREALGRLRTTLGALAAHPIDELCDKLLTAADLAACEDDVALIALRGSDL